MMLSEAAAVVAVIAASDFGHQHVSRHSGHRGVGMDVSLRSNVCVMDNDDDVPLRVRRGHIAVAIGFDDVDVVAATRDVVDVNAL